MNIYYPGIDERVFVHGRTEAGSPLPLYWTGSGIEFVVDGSSLFMDFYTDYNVYEQWIRVEVDGFTVTRLALLKGSSSLCIYRGMNAANKRHVRLYKEVQPMLGDVCRLMVEAVRTDGEIYAPETPKCRLEFIGDSITSGEGLGGSAGVSEWCSFSFSTKNHYAFLTGKALSADVSVLSQSGWGTYCSWDNNPDMAMPKIYDRLCAVAGDRTGERGWNFSSFKADAVVINLGTNDGGAFDGPEYVDAHTGRTHKQRRAEDGSYGEQDIARFHEAATGFLRAVREHNPDAYILWVYGMLGNPMEEYIKAAIDEYKAVSGDARVSFKLLPDMLPEWRGLNDHPGAKAHEAAAKALCMELSNLLKLEYEPSKAERD